MSNDDFVKKLHLSSDNNYSRTAMLAEYAAREACYEAKLKDPKTYRTGLISSTSVAGMDMTEKYFYSQLNENRNRKYIESHPANDAISKVAKALGIDGFVTTISTACSSSANAIMLGSRMIKSGQLDRVVVGGSDCLSKFTINGFKSLMILSESACRPFDANRTGLNLGEAAAFLVLENEDIAKREQKKILARVSGYANANDAFHQTASSENGDGAALAMTGALESAGLRSTDIDYINAHGTATANNDLSESKAILRVFGKEVPYLSSTKAFTGHTLAAAAAVEAVYSILALQEQTIWPNLNFSEVIQETGIEPVTNVLHTSIEHVLSNSFGFGGNCSTLIFSKA
jgi:3-oxoacyl-[acyl-carrier-protein] synthase-1